MTEKTNRELVYEAFQEKADAINWEELHGKTFRVFVSVDRAVNEDKNAVLIGLYDERTKQKYIFPVSGE